jgi:hypothetical protein
MIQEFAPHLVLVALGFDACVGDPVGGYRLSPSGYGGLIRRLMTAVGGDGGDMVGAGGARESAKGRIVAALEGGYNHEQSGRCAEAVITALLGKAEETAAGQHVPLAPLNCVREGLEEEDEEDAEDEVRAGTKRAIEEVMDLQRPFWRCFGGGEGKARTRTTSAHEQRIAECLAAQLASLQRTNAALKTSAAERRGV